jgi:S1-C subfamily serine protease
MGRYIVTIETLNKRKRKMKTLTILLTSLIFLFVASVPSAEVLRGLSAHEKYVYPTVRVSSSRGTGSGTVVYSKLGDKPDCYSTYILTNFHVIAGLISITENWDSDLQANVKQERRGIAYVEIFKYKDLSVPVGTTKLEADIVIYNRQEDMALIKLRYEGTVDYIAQLPTKENVSAYKVMDESVAVGCSLGWPPLVSTGVITRKNYQIDSIPYDMSSAQIIYGNSGGGMYTADGVFIGIPSMVPVVGWSSAITHMGLFIPVERIFAWWDDEHYDFIYDGTKMEKESLEIREEEIEAKKKAAE